MVPFESVISVFYQLPTVTKVLLSLTVFAKLRNVTNRQTDNVSIAIANLMLSATALASVAKVISDRTVGLGTSCGCSGSRSTSNVNILT